MNNDYTPTPLEKDLIDTFRLLYPRVELSNYPGVDKTLRSAGAIGHELYSSLVSNGYPITIDPGLVENRGMKPEDEEFFAQVHCAGNLLSQLPPRNKGV